MKKIIQMGVFALIAVLLFRFWPETPDPRTVVLRINRVAATADSLRAAVDSVQGDSVALRVAVTTAETAGTRTDSGTTPPEPLAKDDSTVCFPLAAFEAWRAELMRRILEERRAWQYAVFIRDTAIANRNKLLAVYESALDSAVTVARDAARQPIRPYGALTVTPSVIAPELGLEIPRGLYRAEIAAVYSNNVTLQVRIRRSW